MEQIGTCALEDTGTTGNVYQDALTNLDIAAAATRQINLAIVTDTEYNDSDNGDITSAALAQINSYLAGVSCLVPPDAPSEPPPNEEVTIAFDGFESNALAGGDGRLASWRKKGRPVVVAQNPAEGQYYARLRAKNFMQRPLDLSGISVHVWSFRGCCMLLLCTVAGDALAVAQLVQGDMRVCS